MSRALFMAGLVASLCLRIAMALESMPHSEPSAHGQQQNSKIIIRDNKGAEQTTGMRAFLKR